MKRLVISLVTLGIVLMMPFTFLLFLARYIIDRVIYFFKIRSESTRFALYAD